MKRYKILDVINGIYLYTWQSNYKNYINYVKFINYAENDGRFEAIEIEIKE